MESFLSKDTVLVSSGIGHALIFLILLRVDIVQESLAMRRLLVKLDEVATSTAVRLCHIFQTRALKIIFLSNRCALHACKDTVQTGHTEQEALEERRQLVEIAQPSTLDIRHTEVFTGS